jgi:hypothetical protein
MWMNAHRLQQQGVVQAKKGTVTFKIVAEESLPYQKLVLYPADPFVRYKAQIYILPAAKEVGGRFEYPIQLTLYSGRYRIAALLGSNESEALMIEKLLDVLANESYDVGVISCGHPKEFVTVEGSFY